jgi:hypothetical protein
MNKYTAAIVAITAVLYGIAISIIMAAGILWAVNSIFGTQFEMNLYTYIIITAITMLVHVSSRNATN